MFISKYTRNIFISLLFLATAGTLACGGAGPITEEEGDAKLSGLELSLGTLSPAFDPATTDYTASTKFLSASLTVTPTAADSAASITVNGESVTSGETSSLIAVEPSSSQELSGIFLDEGANTITIVVTASDGVTTETYTITVTRESLAAFAQQAYVKASNTEDDDRFGDRIALSGDTMVVGAPREDSNSTGVDSTPNDDGTADNSGAVYVFVRSGSTWTQQAYLKASNTEEDDRFGNSVAISGDTLVVGANSEDSNATGVDGDQDNNDESNSGAAYVFVRSGTTWSQQAYLKASNTDANDKFGERSIAISGDTIVVGANGEASNATGVDGDQANNDESSSGAAYVFVRSGTTWSQQAYLKASNTEAGDQFGDSIDISGDTIVVGADGEDSNSTGVDSTPNDDDTADNSGAAYVFTRSGTTWTQQAYLKASNAEGGDVFGESVAISGDTVVVGANGEDSSATGVNGDQSDNNLSSSGAAYVFTRSGTTWSQQAYLKASNAGQTDNFGQEGVAISGDTLAVGGRGEDSIATGINGDQSDNSADTSSAVYIFTRSGTTWSQQVYLKSSNSEAGDAFGIESIAISGDTIVVGANGEDSNAIGVDGDQANNDASSSGAAYVLQ